MINKIRLSIALVLICLLNLTHYSYAAAMAVAPMQSSITGLIAANAERRGINQNDPRFQSTINSMSGVLTSALSGGAGAAAGAIAATVVVGAVTAPAWMTMAIAAGVGAVVTTAVTLGVNSLINWAFSSDPNSSTPITQSNVGDSSTQGGLVAGQPYWASDVFKSTDAMAAIHAAFSRLNVDGGGYTYSLDGCTSSSTQVTCGSSRTSTADKSKIFWGNQTALYSSSAAPRTCPKGQLSNATTCVALPVYTIDPNPQVLTPQQALDGLTADEKAQPLNPQILANVANTLWQHAAAKPNYGGIPYDATNPITAADAQTLETASPTTYPTVGDFVNPQNMANSPFTLPLSPTAPTQDLTQPNAVAGINPAAANPLENLGTDPVIGNPTLEDTPTATMILQPILSLFPDFRSFVVPPHQSVCPKPTFNLFGKSIVMDAQCTIVEQQRDALYAIMALVWLIAGAIIVLRA